MVSVLQLGKMREHVLPAVETSSNPILLSFLSSTFASGWGTRLHPWSSCFKCPLYHCCHFVFILLQPADLYLWLISFCNVRSPYQRTLCFAVAQATARCGTIYIHWFDSFYNLKGVQIWNFVLISGIFSASSSRCSDLLELMSSSFWHEYKIENRYALKGTILEMKSPFMGLQMIHYPWEEQLAILQLSEDKVLFFLKP